MTSRRDFIKKMAVSTAGVALSSNNMLKSSTMGMSAKSYSNIIGANDRINVAILGLGRRISAFYEPVSQKQNNIHLSYLCDVMKSQRESAAASFAKHIDYQPKLENDLHKIMDDSKVDAIINATPDHWHAPGSIMALKARKHVYVEKPCSHNMHESDLLVAAQKRYDRVVQMGNQQRSSDHTIEIINEIHNGVIGTPYKAVAFYTNQRGETPLQKKTSVREGLDWELFQGPAPRRDYTSETWDYNWHWYGWDYGTGEAGNNGTHELDIARWALQVDYPIHADVQAEKRHFLDDGWEMYDTMFATFKFANGVVINWDGKSRNGYDTYGGGRGTIIYGSEGSVFIDRSKYILYDRSGKKVKDNKSATKEGGNVLGGGGDMTTRHVVNWFNAIRGKENLASHIAEGVISQAMVHYSNIAYRINKGFDIDDKSGRIFDRDAMALWSREYEPGWEPTL